MTAQKTRTRAHSPKLPFSVGSDTNLPDFAPPRRGGVNLGRFALWSELTEEGLGSQILKFVYACFGLLRRLVQVGAL